MTAQTDNPASETATRRDQTRWRILTAAMTLLAERGRDGVTTRAVADAAGVQAPVLYRHFKDKDAMLEALAEHGFETYVGQKRRRTTERDPVQVLRSGWDLHIAFGLTHPALYLLMYAHPRPGAQSSAGERSLSLLRQHVGRIAAAGRLRVTEPQAVALFHAAAVGVVLGLLHAPEDARDMAISHMARDAALSLIADGPASPAKTPAKNPAKTAAITLRAALDRDSPFSAGELSLLQEWLGRLARMK